MGSVMHEVEEGKGITRIRNDDDGEGFRSYMSSDPREHIGPGPNYEAMQGAVDDCMKWFDRNCRKS